MKNCLLSITFRMTYHNFQRAFRNQSYTYRLDSLENLRIYVLHFLKLDLV